MRAFAAVSLVVALCAAPAFAAPRSPAAQAKKAERRGEWRKALRAWKAAYAKDARPEYLISIGDAYAHLGEMGPARKSYEAYLADPLAVPASIAKVKSRMERLDRESADLSVPMLPLPGVQATPAVADRSKPAAPPLPLPRADGPVASATPARTEAPVIVKHEPVLAAATADAVPLAAKVPAAAAPSSQREVPFAAVSSTAAPAGGSSRVQRTVAYVTAGIAIAALGGGALAYTQANSAHNEMTSGIHSPAETQRLLDDENRYRTLTVVGLAGGLLAAGISTALFVF